MERRESPGFLTGIGDASSEALSFLSSSSSGADSSSSGSLPPKKFLPKSEQGTEISDPQAGELELLGKGAFGKVYVDGDDVVKVMPCETMRQLEMAKWEFECMECLGEQCTNVVMAKELARPEGTVALLRMERCAGSIHDFLESLPEGSPLEACEKLALKILLQAAQGLAAVHAKGLVHANIKPESVLLKEFPASLEGPLPQSLVKLCDFGLSFLEEECRAPCGAGTPGYMAPEMEAVAPEGGDAPAALTTKVDVYSLGRTFLDAILIPWPCLEGDADMRPESTALF